MEVFTYRNFPKEKANIILSKWKEYRETFGLEGDLYIELLKKGASQEIIEGRIEERKKIINELWGTKNQK